MARMTRIIPWTGRTPTAMTAKQQILWNYSSGGIARKSQTRNRKKVMISLGGSMHIEAIRIIRAIRPIRVQQLLARPEAVVHNCAIAIRKRWIHSRLSSVGVSKMAPVCFAPRPQRTFGGC
jgi:hypothetical protein